MADEKKDCSTCRYASTDRRPKVMSETGFDDQLMFEDADKDEVVYTCKAFASAPDDSVPMKGEPAALCEHAGKEIGLVPITCSAYAAPVKKDLSHLDKLIAERDARNARKREC